MHPEPTVAQRMIELLRRAAATPCGLAVAVDEPARFNVRMQRELAALAAEERSELRAAVVVKPSPTNPGGEVWLIPRTALEAQFEENKGEQSAERD